MGRKKEEQEISVKAYEGERREWDRENNRYKKEIDRKK